MPKYKIEITGAFKRDIKIALKRGYNMALLDKVVTKLANGEKLEAKYKDHSLSGKFARCKECHITPDWLLLYEISEGKLILYLTRTGTHSDVFG